MRRTGVRHWRKRGAMREERAFGATLEWYVLRNAANATRKDIMKHSFAVLFLLGLAACSAAAESTPETNESNFATSDSMEVLEAALAAPSTDAAARFAARRPGAYTDARWYFTTDDDIDAWYALTHELENDFDDICGDTFCEGDYSNYQSLGIRCSVETRAGRIGVCVWTFAASQEEVVTTTGDVEVSTETWRCTLPVVRGTPVRELMQALSASADAPLHARLPRSESSIYDGLVSCL
jgi:hypothetical protein